MKKIKVSVDAELFPKLLNKADWTREGTNLTRIINDNDNNYSYYKMLFGSTGVPYWFEDVIENVVTMEAKDIPPTTKEDLDRLHAAMEQVDKELEVAKAAQRDAREQTIEIAKVPDGDIGKKPTKREGFVGSYVHANGRIGVLVKVYTTTDFAARTDELKIFARNVSLQVAAMGTDDLLNQEFIKDPRDIGLEAPSVTMKDVLEKIRKDLGEQVEIGSVIRFEI